MIRRISLSFTEWLIPTTIVVVNGLVFGYTVQTIVEFLFIDMSVRIQRWLMVIGALNWVLAFILPFIVWLAISTLSHLTALLLNGSGRFRDLFFFYGYGLLPMLIAYLINYSVYTELLTTVYSDIDSLNQVEEIGRHPQVLWLRFPFLLAYICLAFWGIIAVRCIHRLTWIGSTIAALGPIVAISIIQWLLYYM